MGVLPLTSRERQLQKKTQFLPWIVSPLTHFFHEEHNHESHELHSQGSGVAIGKAPSIQQEVIEEHEEIEEATPMELFYDLFFVANLTTVTSVHAINDTKSLASYVLFFIILWFTWLQVTLYDIRFSVDSVYERTCKAIHFAVMIGFSSVSTKWDPFESYDPKTEAALKTMTLVLMGSRLVLAFQYGVVLFYAFKAKKAMTPLAIHSISMLLAAIGYLGLFFAFNNNQNTSTKTYVAWYIICPLEAIAVLSSSSIWRIVSFKSTHLVERLGLLTLIVIGEGIIVMLKAVNTVAKASAWNGSALGVVLSAVAIIYSYWMFYFDYTPQHSHYGTIRQQIWAVLHFPLHLAIVLSVEGLRQFTTFFSFIQQTNNLMNKVVNAGPNILGVINGTLTELFEDGTSKTVLKSYLYNQDELNELIQGTSSNQTDLTLTQRELMGQVLSDLIIGYSEYFGIKTPKEKGDKAPVLDLYSPEFDPLKKASEVFDLVFYYFFAALGCVFVMYGVLGLFVRRRKDAYDYLSVALRFAIAIIFFGILSFPKHNYDKYLDFTMGAWPLPMIALILFFSLVIDKTINWIAYKHLKGMAKRQ